jgi:hypothetical protein
MVGVLMRLRHQRWSVLVGVVAVGLGLTSCGGDESDRSSTAASSTVTDQSSHSTDEPKETVTVRVVPLSPDGVLDDTYGVVESADGATCPRPSGLVFSAFSCSAGDLLYDPCWEESQSSVVCMAQAWSDEVHRLQLEQPITVDPLEGVDDSPWGIELESGLRCRLESGARGTVGEDVIDYVCGDDEAVVLLRGTIDRSSAYWTVGAAERADDGYERVDDQTITTVWFGS